MKQIPFFFVVACLFISGWIDLIAILTYVGYELELSVLGVALVAIAMLAPQAVLGRLITSILQRVKANRVLLAATTVGIGCTLSLIWVDTLDLLLPVLFLRGFAAGFVQPVIAGAVKSVGEGEATRFASTLNLLNTFAKIGAPAVGGVLSVQFGEASVFLLSSLLAAIVLPVLAIFPLPDSARHTKECAEGMRAAGISPAFLAGFGACILAINGLSLMFTNLLPYALNFYGVPKLTLSLALSASALAATVFNLYVMKVSPKLQGFPKRFVLTSWVMSAVGFAALSVLLPFHHINWAGIPLVFMVLSIGRVLFEVSTNGFIYAQEGNLPVALATFKQSFAAYAGIIVTLLGALGLQYMEPLAFMLGLSGILLLLGILWAWVPFDKPMFLFSREQERPA
ncbi:MFS transporter [Flexibacterium corallicola]|uniref:MFS transporter n=1 Tax=Flexibacterium corallicola TaxID=3037259 RepID=UPI00286F1D18|nr:MFS transporter [Pseudovibrio sp. M1P-2-3]